MNKRVEGCSVQFGRYEHYSSVPVCMGGNAMVGCVQYESCREIKAERRKVEARQRVAQERVIQPSIDSAIKFLDTAEYITRLRREGRTAEEIKKATQIILDLAIDELASSDKLYLDEGND